VPYHLRNRRHVCSGWIGSDAIGKEPNEILGSIWQVNLFSEGSEQVVRKLKPSSVDVNPDEAAFQKVDMDYVIFNVAELDVTSDKTILIADAETPSKFSMTPVRIDAGETVRYLRENREAPPLPLDPSSVTCRIVRLTKRPSR
jgi:hypothetical protein